MLAGLGIATSSAPLNDKEEDLLGRFFAYGLNLTRTEYEALPSEERQVMEQLNSSWHLIRLHLTRTATRKN